MDSYAVRGIYVIFALGATAVLFARGVAYWFTWQAWTVRIIGLCLLGLGTLGVFDTFGASSGMKALVTVALGSAVYIWQDLICARKENELRGGE